MHTVNFNIPDWAANYFNQVNQAEGKGEAASTKSTENNAKEVNNAEKASALDVTYSAKVTTDSTGKAVYEITVSSSHQTLFETLSNLDEIKHLSTEQLKTLLESVTFACSTYEGTALESFLGQLTMMLGDLCDQKSRIDAVKADIEGVKDRPIEQKIEMFNQLKDKLQQLSSGGLESVINNSPLYQKELQNCLMQLGMMISESMVGDSVSKDPTVKANIGQVATLISHEAGIDIKDAISIAAKVFGFLGDTISVVEVSAFLTKAVQANTLQERSQCIDNIFRGGYPHTSDIALTIKQSLCGSEQEKQDIATLHTLTLSRDLINQKYLAAKGQEKHAGPATNFRLSPENFTTTTENGKTVVSIKQKPSLVVENAETRFGAVSSEGVIAGKVPTGKEKVNTVNVSIKNFDIHLAHVAMLEAQAMQKGLLDAEVLRMMLDDIAEINNLTNPEDKAKHPRFKQLEPYLDYRTQMPDHSLPLADRLGACVNEQGLREMRKLYADDLLTQWGNVLNLQQYIKAAGNEGAELTEKLMVQMDQANKFFAMGIGSTNELQRVQKKINEGVENVKGHFQNTSGSEALFRRSPKYVCRQILNRQMFNITGVIDSDIRYKKVDDPKLLEVLHGEAKRLLPNQDSQSLKDQIFLGRASEELSQVKDYKDEKLLALKGHRRTFLKNHALMSEMAQHNAERVEVQARLQEKKALVQQHQAVWDSMGWVWPFKQPKQRREMAQNVLELQACKDNKAQLQELIKQCDEKINQTTDLQEILRLTTARDSYTRGLQTVENKAKALVAKLQDVDPHTLISTGKTDRRAVSENLRNTGTLDAKMQVILTTCLQNAKAVSFFASQEYQGIKATIKDLEKQEEAFVKTQKKFLAGMKKMYGAEGMQFLESAIQAAVAKLCLVSGQEVDGYKVNQQEVIDLLKQWGITIDKGFSKVFMELVVGKMTNENGELDRDKLGAVEKNIKMSQIARVNQYLATLAVEQMGASTADAIRAVRHQVEPSAIKERSLEQVMDEVVDKGGFSYDYSEGFFFSPKQMLGDEKSLPGPMTGLAWELNVQALMTDGFHVRHTDDGAYEVLLTGGVAVMLSTSIEANLFGASSAYAQVGEETKHNTGVLLRFGEKGDCLNFLKDIMIPAKNDRPKTGPYWVEFWKDVFSPAADKNDPKALSWMNACEVRNVTFHSQSYFATLSASPIDFSPSIIPGVVVSVISQYNLQTTTESATNKETNANGTIVTTSSSRYTTVQTNALMLEIAATTGGQEMPIFQAAAGSVEKPLKLATEKFTTCMTPTNKIRADTSREYTIAKRGHSIMQMLKEFGLNQNQIDAIVQNEQFFKQINDLWPTMGNEDTITLKSRIKPSVLDEVNRLNSLGRAQGFKQAMSHTPADPSPDFYFNQANKLLSDPNSYEPEALIFDTESMGITHGFNRPAGDKDQDHVYFYCLGYMQEQHLTTSSKTTMYLPQNQERQLVPLKEAIYSTDAKFYLFEHIVRGTPTDQIQEAMEIALRAGTLNQEEIKLLRATLDRYDRLHAEKPVINGSLECQCWNAFTADHPLGVSEAAVQNWLQLVSNTSMKDVMQNLRVQDCEALAKNWENKTGVDNFMKPSLTEGSSPLVNQGPMNKHFDQFLAGMKPGDYHWIMAKSEEGGGTHAMGVYCDANNNICFFDPASGMYTGNRNDLAHQMADCTRGWDSLTLYSGTMQFAEGARA